MKLYTKTGDGGQTSLYGGARRSKADLRVEAYGEIDELQAVLGVCLAHCDGEQFAEVQEVLLRIQYHGFVLCCELARPADMTKEGDPRLFGEDVEWMELQIDRFDAQLPELRSFIMQGGSLFASHLHLARAVCRRAERSMVLLSREEGEEVGALSLQYVNRLSDLLFVLARLANHVQGEPETTWTWDKGR